MRRIALLLAFALGLAVPASSQAPSPVPALPDTARVTTYSLSASTCACSVGFALYGDNTDVDEWIQVFVAGKAYLSTDPTFGWSLSSVTGSLGTIPRPITNAVLTFNSPQTAAVVIVGARRPRRLSQFSENRGVAARDLNQTVTDIIATQREIWDKSNRTIVVQPGEALNVLPSATGRIGQFLSFDSTGQPIMSPPTSAGGITPVTGTPLLGYIPIGTGSSAVWGNTITTTGIQSGINTSQTGSGTITPADFNYNHFSITDTINAGNNGNFNISGFRVDLETGGTTVEGSRVGIYGRVDLTTATINNPQNTYSGMTGVVTAAANAGGTGTGASSSGQLFAIAGGAYVLSGATYYTNLTGLEMGVSVASGSNLAPRYKFVFNAVPFPTDAQHATALEAAYGISAQTGAVGLNWGILFHDGNGQTPLSAAGTVLGTEGTQTTTHGIDLSAWTFTSDQFKGTGFLVNGSGNVATLSLMAGSTTVATVPFQVHLGTNENVIIADNAGSARITSINDALNSANPLQISTSNWSVDGSGNGVFIDMKATTYHVGATAGASCTLTTVSHLTVVNGLVTLCN